MELKGIWKWLWANTDLLLEIRSVIRYLPELEVLWIKVKARQTRVVESCHKVINDEIDKLANTVHADTDWQAQDSSQYFTRKMVELKTRKTRSTGNAGKSLQHAFTTGSRKGVIVMWN